MYKIINPLMPGGLFYLFHWAGPCATEGESGLFLFIISFTILKKNHALFAISVDHDQTPHFAASDLGLALFAKFCLLRDVRYK